MFEVIFLSSHFLIYSAYVIYVVKSCWESATGFFVIPVCNAKLL